MPMSMTFSHCKYPGSIDMDSGVQNRLFVKKCIRGCAIFKTSYPVDPYLYQRDNLKSLVGVTGRPEYLPNL